MIYVIILLRSPTILAFHNQEVIILFTNKRKKKECPPHKRQQSFSCLRNHSKIQPLIQEFCFSAIPSFRDP